MASDPRSGHDVLEAAQRRLARLRFDLHDGPQQDVVLLAQDLALLRSELRDAIGGHPEAPRVLGLLDDLQSRLVSLDSDLRRLASFAESPFLGTGSVPDALAELSADFSARSGVDPDLAL